MVAQKGATRIPHDIGNLQNSMVILMKDLKLTFRNALVSELHAGIAPECFAAHVYQHREEYGLSENEAMFAGKFAILDWTEPLVLNAIEGGSDTTRATLNVFVAAMATDPEFLVRVRNQIEGVCGFADRLPTFEDQAQLPLVTACVKEVLRWMPLVAAGIINTLNFTYH
jgi:hypothetical protein